MLIPWIDAIPDVHQDTYQKMADTIGWIMTEPVDKTGPLMAPLTTFTPARARLEAAMAYVYAIAATYPYRELDTVPDWVGEVDDLAITDYLDTDSDEAMVRFARLHRAGTRDQTTEAGLHLARYFNFAIPHDAAVGALCFDYLANRANQEVARLAARGVWRLLGEEFHAHADLPQVVGGSAPEQVPVRAASSELARLLRAAGMTKVRIAELFNVTRMTLDGWLNK